jgi:hypothetical protein
MSAKFTGWMARHKAELLELSPYATASLLLPGGTFLAAFALLRKVQPVKKKAART